MFYIIYGQVSLCQVIRISELHSKSSHLYARCEKKKGNCTSFAIVKCQKSRSSFSWKRREDVSTVACTPTSPVTEQESFRNNLNKNYNFRVVDSELSCVTQISTPTSMRLIFVTCCKCKIYIQVIGRFGLIVLCHTS